MMKNTKVVSLLSVALFALTGCNKTCTKEEFLALADKTESQPYVKATAKVKGKLTSSTGGVKQIYEPDDSFDFIFTKNGEWTYDDSSDSLSSTKLSVVTSCKLLLTMNVRYMIDQKFFDGIEEEGKVTFYSSPLGFNAKMNYDNLKEGDDDVASIVLNGKSDTTYFFDSKSGNITSYTEKSDITVSVKYSDVEVNTSTVSDLKIDFTYAL